ncbi:MAG: hypothetical protein AMXMBFR36_13480 [Acidobacteriota bacterium]
MIPRPRLLRLALLAALVAVPMLAQTPADQRSTGGTETELKPAALPPGPQAPVKVVLAEGKTRHLVEGMVRAGSPAVVLWEAPVGRMLNAQAMSDGYHARVAVYQPGAERPDGGAAPEDGAIRWIGECTRAGELRFEVHSTSKTDAPFKLGLEIVEITGGPEPSGN